MCQEPLGQGRDERRLGDRHGGLRAVGQEVVGRRRAGAVAGEEERDQAVDPGVIVEVGGRQAVRRIGPRPDARPVLAEQGPLLGRLIGMALGPAQAVRRGEEERRAWRPGRRRGGAPGDWRGWPMPEEATRPEAAGLGDRPGRGLALGRRESLDERLDQAVGARTGSRGRRGCECPSRRPRGHAAAPRPSRTRSRSRRNGDSRRRGRSRAGPRHRRRRAPTGARMGLMPGRRRTSRSTAASSGRRRIGAPELPEPVVERGARRDLQHLEQVGGTLVWSRRCAISGSTASRISAGKSDANTTAQPTAAGSLAFSSRSSGRP